MSGTTAHGWPYVTPDDHPVEFPAASQALANKLESTPRVQSGFFLNDQTLVTAGTGVQFTISYPAPFSASPVLVATAGGGQFGTVTVQGVYPTYAEVTFHANLGVDAYAGINWVAVGVPNAAGLLPAEEA